LNIYRMNIYIDGTYRLVVMSEIWGHNKFEKMTRKMTYDSSVSKKYMSEISKLSLFKKPNDITKRMKAPHP
jgi:hypothetical protein